MSGTVELRLLAWELAMTQMLVMDPTMTHKTHRATSSASRSASIWARHAARDEHGHVLAVLVEYIHSNALLNT